MGDPTPGTDSWRTWLLTGARGGPTDRRRLRGAHRGLKQLLIEGMRNGGDQTKPWNDFSGAMVRQAVNEAMNALPPEQKQVVKLAYFGGLSNREIAHQLGLTVGGVQRRLRRAVAYLSEYVEYGRAVGRRAVGALVIWLSGQRLGHAAQRAWSPAADHLARGLAVLVAGAGAAGLLVSQPAAPARQPAVSPHSRPPATSVASVHAVRASRGPTVTIAAPRHQITTIVTQPVTITLPVLPLPLPSPPPLPKVHLTS